MKLEPNVIPMPTQPIEKLTDRLMKCVLAYKDTREDVFLRDMQALANDIRAAGYHPYFVASSEILIVSREPLMSTSDPETEHSDA
jgi:hypothetical protein